MNKVKAILLTLCLMFLAKHKSNAQSIYFQNTDGTKTIYNLEDVRKITMKDHKVQLYMRDGNKFERDMATLQNYRYDESNSSNTIHEVLSEVNKISLKVYPNPTENILHLSYVLLNAEMITCRIFDSQGKKVSEFNFGLQEAGHQNKSISLNELPTGNYAVQITGQHWSLYNQIVRL